MTDEEMILETAIGVIKITVSDQQLKQIQLNFLASDGLSSPLLLSEYGGKVAQQITAYFDDCHFQFSLKALYQGTDFQRKVWRALTEIPVGETLTYGQLATELDSGPRAVANACRKNPIPIVVPCHRVVSASGVGGFAGQSKGQLINIKQTLLRHEGVKL